MSRRGHRIRFALAYPDAVPLAGSVLALLAITLHTVVLPGAAEQLEAAEYRLGQIEKSYRRQLTARHVAEAPERRGLLDRFADDRRLPDELGRLLELTERAGLQLQAGEYRLVASQGKLFDRYVLNLPVRGAYSDVRAYLASLPDEFPAVAVEEVILRRESIASGELEAQLRLVIFARRRGGA